MPEGRPARRRLETAITRSVEDHGTIASWVTDEMLAERRAEAEGED